MSWLGRVTRVVNGLPYVRVPDLGGEREYGPLDTLAADLTEGQAVVVDQLGSRRDALVVLGALAPHTP